MTLGGGQEGLTIWKQGIFQDEPVGQTERMVDVVDSTLRNASIDGGHRKSRNS